MTGRLGGTEVVARGYHHSVDAVVNTFIMCGGTIFVDMRDVDRLLEFLSKALSIKMFVDAVEVVDRSFNPHFDTAVRCVVRQYRHHDFDVFAATEEVILQSMTERLET